MNRHRSDVNGRDSKGRFTKGNAGGPGAPLAGKVAKLRSALLDAVTEDDIKAIASKMVEQAKSGDMAAVREPLLRILGKPTEHDLIERLERVEGVAHTFEIKFADTRGDTK